MTSRRCRSCPSQGRPSHSPFRRGPDYCQPVPGASVTTTADWLTAIGGVCAAIASVVLAFLAYRQMKATREQSEAALDQPRTSKEQALIAKDAAAAQVYPLVYAHEWKGTVWDEGEQAFAVRYYLSNEGLGPALNVEHGVKIGRVEFMFGRDEPYMFRSVQPGEFLPPLDPERPDPVPPQPITRNVERRDMYLLGPAGASQQIGEMLYVCRYENLFGDRWETVNSNDPQKRPTVRRITDAGVTPGVTAHPNLTETESAEHGAGVS